VNRYLVVYDYGMGGMWWWVNAPSPEAVVRAVAEVQVITDPQYLRSAAAEELDEVDLDAIPDGHALADLRDQRTAQRDRPGFGALAGRERVVLRDDDEDYGGSVYLEEHGPDGRMTRQVRLDPDGRSFRYDQWPFTPPVDLWDPDLADREVPAAEFERAWAVAEEEPPEQ
jgi:hypothetical protein